MVLCAFFKRYAAEDIVCTYSHSNFTQTKYSRVRQATDVLGEIEREAGEWVLWPDCVGGADVANVRDENDLCFGVESA